jgi:hypothetical protein
MSNGFDPYYQWLGIAPKDQPPNHYRLLGLDLFEGHPDVIESAADRQMAHIRLWQRGPQGDLSQKLLNEITTAKLCLLSAAKKAEYDAKLRAEKEATEAAARPKARAVRGMVPRAEPLAPADTDLGPPLPRPPAMDEPDGRDALSPLDAGSSLLVPGSSRVPKRLAPRHMSVGQQAAIAGAGLGVVVVIAVAVLLTRGSGPKTSQTTTSQTAKQSSHVDPLGGESGKKWLEKKTPSTDPAKSPPEVATPFNGKDFAGWQFKNPDRRWIIGKASLDPKNAAEFVTEKAIDAQKAELINAEAGSDIYTTTKYADCTIDLEFMVGKGCDSGVYVMGEYEVQIFDSYGKQKIEPADLGGVFAPAVGTRPADARTPRTNAAKAPGAWQKMVIEFRAPKFQGDRKIANAEFVKIAINGQVIHEYVEMNGPNVGGLTGSEAATGPLMLQGAHGRVAFRNIRITPKWRPDVAHVPMKDPLSSNPVPPAIPKPPPKPGRPSSTELEDARQQVRQIFEAEIKESRTPKDKSTLARRLLDRGAVPNGTAALNYALIDEAAKMAIEVGDV